MELSLHRHLPYYWSSKCYFIYNQTTSDACPNVGISSLLKPYFYIIGYSPDDCIYGINRNRNFSSFIYAKHARVLSDGVWYSHSTGSLDQWHDVPNHGENI